MLVIPLLLSKEEAERRLALFPFTDESKQQMIPASGFSFMLERKGDYYYLTSEGRGSCNLQFSLEQNELGLSLRGEFEANQAEDLWGLLLLTCLIFFSDVKKGWFPWPGLIGFGLLIITVYSVVYENGKRSRIKKWLANDLLG